MENKDFLEAYIDPVNIESGINEKETNALSRTAISQFENYDPIINILQKNILKLLFMVVMELLMKWSMDF